MAEINYLGRRIGFNWVKCWTGRLDEFAVVCDIYVDGKLSADVRYGNSPIPPSQQESLGAKTVGVPLREFRRMLERTRPAEDAMPKGTF